MFKKILLILPILLILSGCALLKGVNPEFNTSTYIAPSDAGEKTITLVAIANEGKQKDQGDEQLLRFSSGLKTELEKRKINTKLINITPEDMKNKNFRAKLISKTKDKYILWVSWWNYRVDGHNGGVLTVQFDVSDTKTDKFVWSSSAGINISLGVRDIAIRNVVNEFILKKIINATLSKK